MKKLVLSLFTAVFLLGASNARADLISSWDFVLEYGFSEWTEVTGNGVGPVTGSDFNANLGNYPSKLSWGDPITAAGQSSIFVEPKSSAGVYEIGDGWELAMTFSHENYTQALNSTYLNTATLQSFFSLVPTIGPPPALANNRDFLIEFWETPNSQHPTDVFYFVNPEDLVFSFTHEDYIYTLEFIIEDLEPLPSWARDYFEVGDGDEFVGLSTSENQLNEFDSSFRLTAKKIPDENVIPEPTTMLLFGVGLLACTGIIRRRQDS